MIICFFPSSGCFHNFSVLLPIPSQNKMSPDTSAVTSAAILGLSYLGACQLAIHPLLHATPNARMPRDILGVLLALFTLLVTVPGEPPVHIHRRQHAGVCADPGLPVRPGGPDNAALDALGARVMPALGV